MIIVNELRIGNLVLINYVESYYAKVLELPRLRVENIKTKLTPLVSDSIVEPIPLTPEWLERMGFQSDNDKDGNGYITYWISKMDGGIAKENDGWYLRIIDIDGYYEQRIGRKIEHVHQLQNLYFALTGKELTIKEIA